MRRGATRRRRAAHRRRLTHRQRRPTRGWPRGVIAALVASLDADQAKAVRATLDGYNNVALIGACGSGKSAASSCL